MSLQGVDFGDERLNKRCGQILERLAADRRRVSTLLARVGRRPMPPTSSSRTRRWMNTRCLNRTVAHHRADESPSGRTGGARVPRSWNTRGSFARCRCRPLNDESRRGFLDHVHLAVTPQRLCLGVVGMDLWARDDETFRQGKERKIRTD